MNHSSHEFHGCLILIPRSSYLFEKYLFLIIILQEYIQKKIYAVKQCYSNGCGHVKLTTTISMFLCRGLPGAIQHAHKFECSSISMTGMEEKVLLQIPSKGRYGMNDEKQNVALLVEVSSYLHRAHLTQSVMGSSNVEKLCHWCSTLLNSNEVNQLEMYNRCNACEVRSCLKAAVRSACSVL